MTAQNRPALGLPWTVLIGLALLAVPRVVLHDLDVIHEGTFVNALFVFVPPLVWVVVAVLARVPRPFLTLLVVGLVYGVLLALGHQLLWGASWEGNPPRLGGNLSDLPPLAHTVLFRGFAVVSSLATGAVVGALSGLVAWVINKAVRPRARAS
ncbi:MULTISPECIES: hypothetical protein [Nocardiopsis]|uniref:Uncharacterized protein n=1 Tax=Nocardiopsis sinuspersici TaxID=501010 RepID=A0A1V3BZG4_9ACTN|nr:MULTISPECIES: hypothetical protein [Nocardiopsis]OOC53520.1 hypothetical protein NOSIN_06635 [Nocardiopsis sinuspersici]